MAALLLLSVAQIGERPEAGSANIFRLKFDYKFALAVLG